MREHFENRHQQLHQSGLDWLESAALVDPERVGIYWDSAGHLARVNLPQVAGQHASRVWTFETDFADDAAGNRERSSWEPHIALRLQDIFEFSRILFPFGRLVFGSVPDPVVGCSVFSEEFNQLETRMNGVNGMSAEERYSG